MVLYEKIIRVKFWRKFLPKRYFVFRSEARLIDVCFNRSKNLGDGIYIDMPKGRD